MYICNKCVYIYIYIYIHTHTHTHIHTYIPDIIMINLLWLIKTVKIIVKL